ncbi:hypothetical protein G9A89_019198 [Geosiphon pyriformis]|nr:hypothetical protein G9A89_019198 [Geosiphon pyriformis]
MSRLWILDLVLHVIRNNPATHISISQCFELEGTILIHNYDENPDQRPTLGKS